MLHILNTFSSKNKEAIELEREKNRLKKEQAIRLFFLICKDLVLLGYL